VAPAPSFIAQAATGPVPEAIVVVVVGAGAVAVLDVDVELDDVEEDVEVGPTVELVGRVDDVVVLVDDELLVVEVVVEDLVVEELVLVAVLLVDVLLVEVLVVVTLVVDVLVVGAVEDVVVEPPAPGGTSVRHSPLPATPL
jgi:hypothetical protein